jgi:Generalcontrol nonderepressible 1 (Gcn1) N-terminal
MSAMIDALIAHQGMLLEHNVAADENISNLILSGLREKRNKIKTSWVLACSELIWHIDKPSAVNSAIVAFTNNISKSLMAVVSEIAGNPVQASQSGTVVSGYAASAIALGRWLDWPIDDLGTYNSKSLTTAHLVKSQGILNIAIAVAPKPSFLLNERIYSKLTNERDQLWAIRALEAVAMQALEETESLWSIAAIFFVVNSKSPRTIRSAGRNMIERVILAMTGETRIKGADIVISGIEEWLREVQR